MSTRADIMEMACKAGAHEKYGVLYLLPEELERFAALFAAAKKPEVAIAEAYRCGEEAGRAAEREACAKVCEDQRSPGHSAWGDGYDQGAADCAAAIRARGSEC